MCEEARPEGPTPQPGPPRQPDTGYRPPPEQAYNPQDTGHGFPLQYESSYKNDPQPGPSRISQTPEPVIGSAAAAGGSVAATQGLMVATNSLGWTSFSAEDQLTIVAAVGIVSPVVAALVARMKVFALR